jgi:hypothetical protein
MYGVLWSVGLLSIFLVSIRNSLRKKKTKELKLNDELKTSPEEISHKNEDLLNGKVRASTLLSRYVDELIPQVFHQQSYFKRMWDEILQNHRYITLFYIRADEDHDDGENKRILTSVHVLTVQTMLMFMLAVFYDLQVSLNCYIILFLYLSSC